MRHPGRSPRLFAQAEGEDHSFNERRPSILHKPGMNVLLALSLRAFSISWQMGLERSGMPGCRHHCERVSFPEEGVPGLAVWMDRYRRLFLCFPGNCVDNAGRCLRRG